MVTVHREKGRALARRRPVSVVIPAPTVIPAKAGIQEDTAGLDSATLDSRLRGNDGERLAVNGYRILKAQGRRRHAAGRRTTANGVGRIAIRRLPVAFSDVDATAGRDPPYMLNAYNSSTALNGYDE